MVILTQADEIIILQLLAKTYASKKDDAILIEFNEKKKFFGIGFDSLHLPKNLTNRMKKKLISIRLSEKRELKRSRIKSGKPNRNIRTMKFSPEKHTRCKVA